MLTAYQWILRKNLGKPVFPSSSGLVSSLILTARASVEVVSLEFFGNIAGHMTIASKGGRTINIGINGNENKRGDTRPTTVKGIEVTGARGSDIYRLVGRLKNKGHFIILHKDKVHKWMYMAE